MRKSFVIASLGLIALSGAAVIVIPAYIERRVIAEASAHGITLTVDHTRIALDGIHLEGAHATTARVPNGHFGADEVATNWDASSIVVSGGEVTLDGPITPPNGSAPEELPVPSSSGPSSVHVQSAHISWAHFAGNSTLDVKNVTGDFSLAPHAGDTFALNGAASMAWSGGAIGPFGTHVSRDKNGEHARISVDPTDPPSETFAFDRNGETTHSEWVVQKRLLSKIGVPAQSFGVAIAGDPTISLHVIDSVTRPVASAPAGAAPSVAAAGLFSFSSDAIRLPGMNDPASMSVDILWKGDPDEKMPVSGGKFHAGPFDGTISGTVSRPDAAFAVDLDIASGAVPCEKFAAADPAALLGGASLGALAALAGVKSAVTGDVKIAGAVHFDSRNPGAAQFSVAPSQNCGVSISLGSGAK